MPVNTPCQAYNEASPQWQIVRDVLAGELVLKNAKEKYLPRPSGQSNEDYDRYIGRTHVFAATSRAAEGLHGSIFAKDPSQSGGDIVKKIESALNNIDGEGSSIDQFAADITWDAMQTCYGGILVDYPNVPVNAPQATVKGAAFLKWYNAEACINWRYAAKNGEKKLSLVVLREDEVVSKINDEFLETCIERYRVLRLDENGNYFQQIYMKDNEGQFIPTEEIVPMMHDKRMTYIPFFPAPGKKPEKSMLLDLAFENIGHYQKMADYENGLHYAGTPTPICENMLAPKERGQDGVEAPIDISLGGSSFLFFKDPDHPVNVKYLEFTGVGMEQISSSIQACEERMAILGARIISAEKKGVETAEVARIHRAGENGVLGAFARNMSEVITIATRVKLEWDGYATEECSKWAYELNTDYDLLQAGSQIISAILGAVAIGTAPKIAGYNVIKKAGLIPENMIYEDYLVELEKDNAKGHEPSGDE